MILEENIELTIQGDFTEVKKIVEEKYPDHKIKLVEGICIGMSFTDNGFKVRLKRRFEDAKS